MVRRVRYSPFKSKSIMTQLEASRMNSEMTAKLKGADAIKSAKACDAAMKTINDTISADLAFDPTTEKIDEKDPEFCGITLGHVTAPMYPASAEAQVKEPAWLPLAATEDTTLQTTKDDDEA